MQHDVEIIAPPVDGWATKVQWTTATIVAAIIAVVATSARGHQLLVLAGLWGVVNIVHLSVFTIWGRARNRIIEEVRLFYGPAIAQMRVGGLPFCIGFIPLGGYVKFLSNEGRGVPPAGSYESLPRWERVGMNLAAPAATFVLAALLLDPRTAMQSFLAGFAQLIDGTFHPRSVAVPLIAKAFALLEAGAFVTMLGVLATKSTAINLLPLPIGNGGAAILETVEWIVPIPMKTRTFLQVASFITVLVVTAVWLYALAVFILPASQRGAPFPSALLP